MCKISETFASKLEEFTVEDVCFISVPRPKNLFPEDLFQFEQNALFSLSHKHSNTCKQYVKNSDALRHVHRNTGADVVVGAHQHEANKLSLATVFQDAIVED
jgi:hypothetical protein